VHEKMLHSATGARPFKQSSPSPGEVVVRRLVSDVLSAVKLHFDAKGVVRRWLYDIADEAVLACHNREIALRKKCEAVARVRKREAEAKDGVDLGDGRRGSKKRFSYNAMDKLTYLAGEVGHHCDEPIHCAEGSGV